MSKPKKGNLELVEVAKDEVKIIPIFDSNQGKHVLQGMELPEFKAITMIRVGQTNDWVHAVLTIKDWKITEVKVGEPNMWQVACDMAKIDFANNFIRSQIL